MEKTVLDSQKMHEKIKTLKQIKIDGKTWEIFYLDEKANEKWVEEKPESHLQGGGYSILRLIEKFPWE